MASNIVNSSYVNYSQLPLHSDDSDNAVESSHETNGNVNGKFHRETDSETDSADNADEGDELVFVQASNRLGLNVNGKSRRGKMEKFNLYNKKKGIINDIELQLASSQRDLGLQRRHARRDHRRYIRVGLIVILVITLVSLIVVLGLKQREKPVAPTQTQGTGKNPTNWTVTYEDSMSESCVRFVDVNRDGALDVITAFVISDMQQLINPCPMDDVCGFMVAIDGKSGEEIWRFKTLEIFTMNCADVDINMDGVPDCICNGRSGILQAIDPLVGKLLWNSNSSLITREFNTFQILALQDLDNDGVRDVILANGGNQSAGPKEFQRDPGRLLLLSGKTGEPIGTFMEMPDGHETYMSPVMYRGDDGTDYVLFGSGGETIVGNFMAISLMDIYKKVVPRHTTSYRPTFPGSNNIWNSHKNSTTDVITIYNGKRDRGVMVPPVIADFNNDGTDDILMTSYDGNVALYSGKTLATLWEREYPGYETYSQPAPGYFDDDDVLDLMIHLNLGLWPHYKHCLTVILSGRDGGVLWQVQGSQYEMASELVVRAEPHEDSGNPRDVYVFTLRGLNTHTHPHHHLQRRHGSKEVLRCDDVQKYDSVIFAVDRFTAMHPWRVTNLQAEAYVHNFTDMDIEELEYTFYMRFHEYFNSTGFNKGPFCSVFSGMERNAGGIADLDGDGSLSLVKAHTMEAALYDEGGSYVKSVYKVLIRKTPLNSNLHVGHLVKDLNITGRWAKTAEKYDERYGNVTLLPYAQQHWTEYMGKLQTSHVYAR